jgi:hypothetical protein
MRAAWYRQATIAIAVAGHLRTAAGVRADHAGRWLTTVPNMAARPRLSWSITGESVVTRFVTRLARMCDRAIRRFKFSL